MVMNTRTPHPAAALAALVLTACGSTVVPPDATADRPTDVGTDASADAPMDTPQPASPCPAAEPTDGASCTRDQIECEYGGDPRRECRDVAACVGTTWRIRRPQTTGTEGLAWCTSAPPLAPCPATAEAASGQSCAAQGAVCTYGGTLCECTSCVSFPVGTCTRPRVWLCDGRPMGCPAAAPRIGDACASEGSDCQYGCNSPGGNVVCRAGVWQRGNFSMCPISTRRAKRDIVYLRDDEVDALAAQVRATRLATWEYTIPAMAGRRRLGFILEDQPGSYAVDPEQSQVDLYGYASLLAATVQSQDRQLRALSRRVEQLERRLAAHR